MALSRETYVGDGVINLYSVPFPYLSKTHLQVFVDAVSDTTFTWVTDSSIALTTVASSGVAVVLKRVTPTAFMVDFEDGATLEEGDLDTATRQALMVAEESHDDIGGLLALNVATGAFDAEGARISNVGNPVNPQDVITSNYLDTAYVPALNALVTAASTSASAASASKISAAASVTAASASEGAAATSATAASVSEVNAASSSTNASTSASTATTQAGIATTKAGEAAADLVLTNADVVSTNADVSTSTTQAGIATTKAGEASTSATNAASSASELTALTTATTTVAVGGSSTSSYDSGTGVLSLGIPTGATGAVGATFSLSGSVLTITTP
jgi:hypothetical protein|tara:strand:- start:664 stop:1659 length:996 start_codon:yes stop_codon:yes gene_type:complete